jgi:hypothetical protein
LALASFLLSTATVGMYSSPFTTAWKYELDAINIGPQCGTRAHTTVGSLCCHIVSSLPTWKYVSMSLPDLAFCFMPGASHHH